MQPAQLRRCSSTVRSRAVVCRVSRQRHIVRSAALSSDAEPYVVRIRRCRADEAEAVAQLCGQAFGYGNFPGVQHELIDRLEQRHAESIRQEAFERLLEALAIKAEATAEVRAWRLQRVAQRLRAQIAAAEGRPAAFPVAPSPKDRRALASFNRRRQFAMLVAEAAPPGSPPHSGQLVGGVTLSIQRPEATLPPPMPSKATPRLYLSNMCVAPGWRRRGIAKKLLEAGEKLGRRWGHQELFLHVRAFNSAGQQLYRSAGYHPVPVTLLDVMAAPIKLAQGTILEQLLTKDLGTPICLPGSRSEAVLAAATVPRGPVGRYRKGSRTFVWGAGQQAAGEAVRDATSSPSRS